MVMDDRKTVIFYGRRCGMAINGLIGLTMPNGIYVDIIKDCKPQTKAEKNQARLKHLRGRAGRWS